MKTTVTCPWCTKRYTVYLPYSGKLVTCPCGSCVGQGKLAKIEGGWRIMMFSELNQSS